MGHGHCPALRQRFGTIRVMHYSTAATLEANLKVHHDGCTIYTVPHQQFKFQPELSSLSCTVTGIQLEVSLSGCSRSRCFNPCSTVTAAGHWHGARPAVPDIGFWHSPLRIMIMMLATLQALLVRRPRLPSPSTSTRMDCRRIRVSRLGCYSVARFGHTRFPTLVLRLSSS